MKQFKTVVLLVAIMVVSVACNRDRNAVDTDTQPAAEGAVAEAPAAPATEAPAQPATPFAMIEPTGDAVATRCAIDKVNATPAPAQAITVESGGQARFSGWISDPEMRVPSQFTIVLAGTETYGVIGTAGSSRPDVARVLKSDALANAGFNVLTTLDAVAPGDYALSIEQNADGQITRCTTSTRITVVKSPV